VKNKSPKVRIKLASAKLEKPKKVEYSDTDLRLCHLPDNFEVKILEAMVTDLSSDLGFGMDSEPDFDYQPFINKVVKSIRSRDPQRITSLAKALSPQCIIDSGVRRADIFFSLYQIGALLKKFPFPSGNGKKVALQSFYRDERSNRLFNEENYKAIIALTRKHPGLYGCIDDLRADIEKLMGLEPKPETVYRLAQHGPGTAVGFEGQGDKNTTFFKWFQRPYTVSSSALPYAIQAIESNPLWVMALHEDFRHRHGLEVHEPINVELLWSETFKIRNYCRYTSVPKTFETERGIAIEPTLNVFLQLGVKAYLYARLKRRWGIDLQTQQKNRDMAVSASKYNDYVTVDLRGASNTVSKMCCVLLLPIGWYDFLDDLRSKKILIPREDNPEKKQKLETEMFSAMGNGFTFAIETIIFAALARYAVRKSGSKGDLSVYGDDIIIPTDAYKMLHELLLLFVFTINEGKTFVDGPFRESCGADCFTGTDVTPIKLDKPIKTVQDLWKVHNSLLHRQQTLPWYFGFKFEGTLKLLRSHIPTEFRRYVGPMSESYDCYLHSAGYKPKRQLDGTYDWWGITTRPVNYISRLSPSTFNFVKLMNSYKPKPEWRVLDPITSGGSTYEIILRGSVRYMCTAFAGYY